MAPSTDSSSSGRVALWALLGLLVSATACGSAVYSRGALWAGDPDGGLDTGTLTESGSTGGTGTGGRLVSGGSGGKGGIDAGGTGGAGGAGSTAANGGRGSGGAGTGGAQTGGAATGGAGTGGAGTGGAATGGAAAGGAGMGSSGGAVVMGGPGDGAQYNFEASGQSWKMAAGGAPLTAITQSTAQSFAGDASLAGSVSAVAGKIYILEVSPPTPAIPAGVVVTFHVFVPSSAMLGAVQPYVLETGSFRFTGARTLAANIARDAWTTINVTVPTGAAAILRMGVQFESTGVWTDTVYLDSISW